MRANNLFDIDPFPGKPKILFIGLAESSHTHSWINLIDDAEFNIRLFAIPTGGYPSEKWDIRTYLSGQWYPSGLDPNYRKCLYPTPEEHEEYKKYQEKKLQNPFFRLQTLFNQGFPIHPSQDSMVKLFVKLFIFMAFLPVSLASKCRRKIIKGHFHKPRLDATHTDAFQEINKPIEEFLSPKASSAEAWLAKTIQEWQPDIIHTLGLYDNQGGLFYYKVRKQYNLEKNGRWVLQLRGGSDLTLRRHDPQFIQEISEILNECDHLISDNIINIEFAKEVEVSEKKFSPLTPVPGTGGIAVDELASTFTLLPSQRERIILWPKTYECPWSKALPVFEAINIAWNQIQPCTIYMTAGDQEEISMWLRTLPDEILKNCQFQPRIPHSELLSLMTRARVLLAPSLVDGIPNTLYEAMACGAFPIVSPLETINTVVNDETNVLFARNLYPHEIAAALSRAMQDDSLVDQAVKNNLELVYRIADRKKIAQKITAYYNNIAETLNSR